MASSNTQYASSNPIQIVSVATKTLSHLNYHQLRYTHPNQLPATASQPLPPTLPFNPMHSHVYNHPIQHPPVPMSTPYYPPPPHMSQPRQPAYNYSSQYQQQQTLDYENNPFNTIPDSFSNTNQINQSFVNVTPSSQTISMQSTIMQSTSAPSSNMPSTSMQSTTMPSSSRPTTSSTPSTSMPSTSIPTTIMTSSSIPSTSMPSTTTSIPTTSIPTTSMQSTTTSSTSMPSTSNPSTSTSSISMPANFNSIKQERQPFTSITNNPVANTPPSQPIQSSTITSLNEKLQKSIESKLTPLFKNQFSTNQLIFQEIEEKLTQSILNCNEFVPALIRSLFSACYKRNKFNLTLFKERAPILNLFTHRDNKKEHDLVNALKRLLADKKLPQEFTLSLYKVLYDEEVVKLGNFLSVLEFQEYSKLSAKLNKLTFPATSTAQQNVPQSEINSVKRKLDNENDENKDSAQKKSKIASVNEEESETSCPICIDTIREIKRAKRRLMTAQCGHVLCKPCVDSLFKASHQNVCPICRKSVIKASFHEIFI